MKSLLCHALALAAALPLGAQTIDAFNPNADNSVRAIAVQPDGKVLIGGTFTTVGGVTRNRIARLNADGTLDTAFSPGANDRILTLAVQPDGKILMGGAFTSVTVGGGSNARNRIARLNPDGSVDTGFNPGANDWVRDIAIQSDGKILVGGSFTTLGGQTRNFIGRLESSGAIDGGFNPGADNQVNTLVAQPDGKVVVGGFFFNIAGLNRFYLARVNANGTGDNSFSPVAGNIVWRVALQPDGKILVGGAYTHMGSQVRSNLARLLPTGALDTAFNPVVSSTVNSLVVRPNGDIIAAGNFAAINGQTRNYIAALKPDGSLDPNFTAGATTTIYSLALQNPDKLLVGGDFTNLGGQPRNRIGRMQFPPPGPPNDNFANSATLAPYEHFLIVDSTYATPEPGEPNHFDEEFIPYPPTRTLWWSWTAPASGPVSLDTTGSGFDTVLAVYTGNAINNLTLVASNHFFEVNSPANSKLGFNATAGQIYRIVVDGRSGGAVVLYLHAGMTTGNDFFANAPLIPNGTLSVIGSNISASREPGEPNHFFGDTDGRSIWWRWTAQTNGPVTIDTGGSSISPYLGIYTGTTISGLTLVAESFDFPESSVTFQAVAGTTYRIVVDSDSESANIVLNFRQRPPNDNFANRILVGGATFSVSGENRAATMEINESTVGFGTKSVWWRWVAPSTGAFTLDTVGSSFKAGLAVFEGSGFPLNAVGSHDGSSGSASRITFFPTQGRTYQIAVYADVFNLKGGDIVLRMAPSESITIGNDFFANPANIPQIPAVLRGSNVGATYEDEPFFDANATLWWSFVAPSNGLATVTRVNGVPELRLLALQGTSLASATVLADSLDLSSGSARFDCAISFPVRAGQTYLICLDSIGVDWGDFVLNFTLTPAPVNDNFANRIVIPPSTPSVSGTTLGSSVESGEPPGGTDSAWWSYTPTNSGPIILTTLGSAIDTFLGVYTGSSVSALTRVATNDAAYTWMVLMGPSNDRPSRVMFNGVAGQPYRIQVSTARGAAGEVMLNFPTLAIEDLLSVSSVLQPNRNLDFTANLRLRNLRNFTSGPLRLRVFARSGYGHLQKLLEECSKDLPALDIIDQELTIVDLPSPGTLWAQGSTDIVVSGVCPPPTERGDFGQGWGAMAVLEELNENTGWEVRDSRLLIFGNWPRVGGFIGPGGGVVTVASGTGQVLPSVGFIDVTVGPPAAVRLGGRWRVSPTNSGSLSGPTNFTSQPFTLATRFLNFSIEVTNLPGFRPPTNQPIQLKAGLHTPLNLLYAVNPPRLFYNSNGLSITGTPGTAYRIEATGRMPTPSPWPSNAGRTLTAGQNPIPNTAPVAGTNRFYRAFWLSD